MAGKKKTSGIVYSTDPEFNFNPAPEESPTLRPAEQLLNVKTDAKHRKGKIVTLVEGFAGKNEDLEALGKQLRTACGSGGSAKEGRIIVQGDHREKIKQLLGGWGYRLKK